jgi:monoterpene epsilon-lactone hydrolase
MPSLQFHCFRPWMLLMRWFQGRFPSHDAHAYVRFRRRADRLAGWVMRTPRDVTVAPAVIGGIPGEWLVPKGAPQDPVMLFLHGGGICFTWGSPHRRAVGLFSQAAGLRTIGIQYRLVPEAIYPAAHDDCWAVYQTLVQQGQQIVLIGESSGGVLALATMLRARATGLDQPILCAMISPVVDYGFQDRRIWKSTDPFVHPRFMVAMHRHYTAGADVHQSDLNPVDADLSGIAPLLVLVGEQEILINESQRLVNAADRCGVPIQVLSWPHVWHGWHVLAPQLPEATRALDALADGIRQHIT